jgi:hypothetical protein
MSASALRPAKRPDSASCPGARVFTQSTPLSLNIRFCGLPRLRQTSSVGGSSLTEHTALTVSPPSPAGPSVVTMFTAAPRRAMASRKSCRVTVMRAILMQPPSCRRQAGGERACRPARRS